MLVFEKKIRYIAYTFVQLLLESNSSIMQLQVTLWTYTVHGMLMVFSKLNIFTMYARIQMCNRLRSSEIDYKESNPPAYLDWRDGTTNRVIVP
jgi:hypothetical protein